MNENNSIVVSDELRTHYNKVLAFQDDLQDPEKALLTKNSDISTAMNATTRLLSTITKELTAAHNAEEFAQITSILVSTLKETDEELAAEFIKRCREKSSQL